MMLVNHVGKHAPCLFPVFFPAESTAAPGYFFPYQKSQFIAKAENEIRLLVMSQADKVSTHCFDLLHFRAHHFLSECGTYSGMVFMAVCAA